MPSDVLNAFVGTSFWDRGQHCGKEIRGKKIKSADRAHRTNGSLGNIIGIRTLKIQKCRHSFAGSSQKISWGVYGLNTENGSPSNQRVLNLTQPNNADEKIL